MSLTIVPMIAPEVLEDMLGVLGKPDRVHLTGTYEEGEKAAATEIERRWGFAPGHVRVSLDVSADAMTIKQIMDLYRANHAEFKAMFDRAQMSKKMVGISIKELAWFKNDVINGVIQGNKEHYYVTFDRYHFRGRINPKMAPKLIQKILEVMKKYDLNFPVSLGN